MHDQHGEHHHHRSGHSPRSRTATSSTVSSTAQESQNSEILVDVANVAFTNRNEPHATGSVENVLAMRQALVDLGFHPIFIADASLKYKVDHPEKLDQLEQEGRIKQAPAGTQADYFLLAYACQENLPIVSNDVFRDRQDEFPKAFERRVPFMIIDGKVILDHERLPHNGSESGR